MPSFSRQPFLVSLLIISAVLPSIADEKPPLVWPRSHAKNQPAKIIIKQKGTDEKPFIYQTKNYELHSHSAITPHNLRQFANVMESVPSVMARIPLPLLKPPAGERSKVFIYPNEATFARAGGAVGASGYYDGKKQAIMLRADAFIKPPSAVNSRLKAAPNFDILVHEFTHLCMHQDLAYLPVWFTEGVAEYLAATHEANGSYRFTNVGQLISRHVRRNLPNDKQTVILPAIKSTMAYTHKSWHEFIQTSAIENHYRPYATALLITHTLFHGGNKRRAETRVFIDAIHESRRLRNHFPVLTKETEKLLPLKDRQALQKRIVTYWRTQGLRIQFQD